MIVFSAFIHSGYRGTRHHLSIKMLSFSVLENKQVRRSLFSVLFMPCNKYLIDQACSVKMAGYWPRSLFAFLWTSTSSRSIKTQKENSATIQPSWPRAWTIIYTYNTLYANYAFHSSSSVYLSLDNVITMTSKRRESKSLVSFICFSFLISNLLSICVIMTCLFHEWVGIDVRKEVLIQEFVGALFTNQLIVGVLGVWPVGCCFHA